MDSIKSKLQNAVTAIRAILSSLLPNRFPHTLNMPEPEQSHQPEECQHPQLQPPLQPKPRLKRTAGEKPILNRRSPSVPKKVVPSPAILPAPSQKVEVPIIKISTIMNQPFWDKVERCEIDNSALQYERFGKTCAHTDPTIINAFASDTPSSRLFLLHYAPKWDSNPKSTPVLLVHGAGHTANLSWKNPFDTFMPSLMHHLLEKGFKVFAITFSHCHGDNYIQAEQLAHAIARVKEITGSPVVDLIAHSKGGMPTRMYTSNIHKDWGSAYRKDVRRYIMLGTPNKGIDYAFRNSLANYATYSMNINSCTSWHKILYCGVMVDIAEHSVYNEGGCFVGQAQMLYKWDDVYPLDLTQPDAKTTYYGGKGLVSESYGIDYAIQQGGHLIEVLNAKGVNKDIELAVLAGNNSFFSGVIRGEYTGPSDGLVFVDSVQYTDGLVKNGAKLLSKEMFNLDHTELITHPQAQQWVEHILNL